MKRSGAPEILLAALAIAPIAGHAHHSLAKTYDRARQLTLSGTIAQLSWVNPHARFTLDVTTPTGDVEHWLVEMDPPGYLLRRGWRLDSISVGDVVTVRGYKAIDGSPRTEAITVKLAGGETLEASDDASWNWTTVPTGTLPFPAR